MTTLNPQLIFPVRCKRLLNSLLFLMLTAFIVVITITFVAHEREFYFWDYKGYQDRSLELATYFRSLSQPSLNDFVALFEAVRASTFNDYSYYPAVLPAAAALALGNSRTVYILALMLFHMLPFALVVGAIATQLFPSRRYALFWATAFVTAMIPTIWRATMRGYPDIGAALLMALAIFLYLRDLKRQRWWHIILIGLLLALSILFRRHFLYAVGSFFVAAALEKGILLVNDWRRGQARRGLLKAMAGSVRISLILVATLIGMVIFGPYFVGRLFSENFSALYASYLFSIPETLYSITSNYGWLLIIAALVGFASAFYSGIFRNPASIFFSLFLGVIFLVWVFIVRQTGEHYPLHFAAGLVIGLVALGYGLWTSHRRVIVAVASIFLIFNFFISLDPLRIVSPYAFQSTNLLSASAGPLINDDYDEDLRLVNFLRGQKPTSVYVASVSGSLNQDLLISADKVAQEQDKTDFILPVLYTPDVDSRDWYPVEQLLHVEWVVVAKPFQHSLAAAEQDVVGVVVRAFSEDWPITQDFQQAAETFHLQNGATIYLYHRIRPTTLNTALLTYQTLADFIGERPLGQADWILLSPASEYHLSRIGAGQYGIMLASTDTPETETISLLYLNPISGKTTIAGNVVASDSCAGFSLRFDVMGDLKTAQTVLDSAENLAASAHLSLELNPAATGYLLLNLVGTAQASAPCKVDIANLSIQAQGE
ncbi:MAG: hypothetical protein ABI690_11880 [Chloroflexota bacterium]